ncbi:hypothetical protein LJC33_07415, partial [Eubacteriales bacterium OttesenSCG-928-N13]|nr:hypothetical protein [Eubacteriales bacterium OttesenSCG-928-N13]
VEAFELKLCANTAITGLSINCGIEIAESDLKLSLKNVQLDSAVAGSQLRGALTVSGNLKCAKIGVKSLTLNKARLILGDTDMIRSELPIQLKGASTMMIDRDGANPVQVNTGKSMTSGSGTLTLKAGGEYMPAQGHQIAQHHAGGSLGRIKLGSGFGVYKISRTNEAGRSDYKLGYKSSAVTLIKGKKSKGYDSFDDALSAIGAQTGYTIRLNRDVETGSDRLPSGTTIDGRDKHKLTLTRAIDSPDALLTLKNLTLIGGLSINAKRLTMSNVTGKNMAFLADEMLVSGTLSAERLRPISKLMLNKAKIDLQGHIASTQQQGGTLTVQLSGKTTLAFSPDNVLFNTDGDHVVWLSMKGSGTLVLDASQHLAKDIKMTGYFTISNPNEVRARLKAGNNLIDHQLVVSNSDIWLKMR